MSSLNQTQKALKHGQHLSPRNCDRKLQNHDRTLTRRTSEREDHDMVPSRNLLSSQVSVCQWLSDDGGATRVENISFRVGLFTKESPKVLQKLFPMDGNLRASVSPSVFMAHCVTPHVNIGLAGGVAEYSCLVRHHSAWDATHVVSVQAKCGGRCSWEKCYSFGVLPGTCAFSVVLHLRLRAPTPILMSNQNCPNL